MKAIWNGAVLADSDATIVIEGNHYFPPDSISWELFEDSTATSRCPWKGRASYYTVVVAGATNRDATWAYLRPEDAAVDIKGHLAFWNGVELMP